MFKVGDKVQHRAINWRGTVVCIGDEEVAAVIPYSPQKPARKIYWKGWDPFDPEHVDWTWDFALVEAS